MAEHEIAQLNVGRTVAPLDDARLAGFVERLAEINALAEASPGFIWRLQDDTGNATSLHYTDDARFIVNLTVWRSIDDLWAYTYRSAHSTVFKRRFEWFERRSGPNVVLWWQSAGTIPTVDDGLRRLSLLEANGASPEAFSFKHAFPAPGDVPG